MELANGQVVVRAILNCFLFAVEALDQGRLLLDALEHIL
jgi:hypothetical protein